MMIWPCLPVLRRGAVLTLTCLALACASSRLPSHTLPLPPPVLTLEPGDTLEVRFLYWNELNQTQAIRPDGKICLDMVGEVQAGGMTVEQLTRQLATLYTPRLKTPEITVVVHALAGQRVYVSGEVRNPGQVSFQGKMTALEAVAAAGGFDKFSSRKTSVVIIRRVGDKNYATQVDLQTALSEAQSEPVFLAPHDIVYVPRTHIDQFDQWVEQYVNRIVPTTLFNISHKVNSDTIIGYGSGN